MSFLAIYITNPSKETAQSVADELIGQKLVACANIFPIESMYWWKGNIEKEGEYVALVKTRIELWQAVCARVEEVHPYDTPCIMKWEVEANNKYETWIRESTRTITE